VHETQLNSTFLPDEALLIDSSNLNIFSIGFNTALMDPKYAASWVSPKGPGDSRPTALEIIKDEVLIGKLNDKVVLITGCSSGIGIETARALKATGATLFLTARNLEKGKKALGDILDSNSVHLLKLDLESLESVRACAKELQTKTKTLNILIK
jgi:NADPH:quinone reductase-like Zn-dependent oxidoreductase